LLARVVYFVRSSPPPSRCARPFFLRSKRAPAPAPAGGVRVLEGEAGALHGRHVVDGDAVQVLRRERVDEDLEAVLFDNECVVSGLLFDEQAVAKAAAAAGLNAHPEP